MLLWISLNAMAYWYGTNCEELKLYDVFSLTDLIVIVTSPLVSLMILSFGRFIYYQLITRVEIKSTVKFKIYSFIIVSILSLFHPISIIVHNFLNEPIKSSICRKSKLLGQSASSINLSFEEYQYIAKTNNFPEIPIQSKVINIFYYEDDFLGDYSIEIIFELRIHDKFNATKRWESEEWKVIKIDSIEKTKTIRYYDFQG